MKVINPITYACKPWYILQPGFTSLIFQVSLCFLLFYQFCIDIMLTASDLHSLTRSENFNVQRIYVFNVAGKKK